MLTVQFVDCETRLPTYEDMVVNFRCVFESESYLSCLICRRCSLRRVSIETNSHILLILHCYYGYNIIELSKYVVHLRAVSVSM